MLPTTSLPGYQLQEYILVLQPHEDLCHRISNIRTELSQKYKVVLHNNDQAHITLAHFFAPEMVEEKIVQRLQNMAMSITPFKVELCDYGAYPSHSVYINIATRSAVQNLVKELKRLKPLLQVPDHDPHFITEPHLVLLQQLKPMQFINIWMECEHTSFSGRFIADTIVLLKRNAYGYETVKQIQLVNMPVVAKQGELF